MKIHVKFDFQYICKNLLSDKLNRLNVAYKIHSTGEIEILQKLNIEEKELLFKELNSSGIEVINSQQMMIVQQIKIVITDIVRRESHGDKVKISEEITNKLPYTYSYLAKIFSDITHITIEKFLILKKIDYVKDLLIEDDLSISEIAYKLNYSSVSHLSKQFKKTTGFNPSYFVNLKKQLKEKQS